MKRKFIFLILTFSFLYPFIQTNAQRLEAAEITLKKTLNGDTLHTYRDFPVDKKLGYLMIEITGSVTSGTISFLLTGPNGKNMQYLIDATTNMEFRHTINLKKMPEYTGDWKIFIDANKAIGSYCLNMRTTVM